MTAPVAQRVQRARETLLKRAVRRGKRARRARVGSNERARCLADARMLGACVVSIDSDKGLQQAVSDRASGFGWRRLTQFVIAYVTEREMRRVAEREARRG